MSNGFKGPWQPMFDAKVQDHLPPPVPSRKLALASRIRFHRKASHLSERGQSLGEKFQRFITCSKSIGIPSEPNGNAAVAPLLNHELSHDEFRYKSYSWMFAFTLPSAVTPQQQAQFEQMLARNQLSAEGVIDRAFRDFVEKHAIQEAMRASVYTGSLSQALQCTIELFLIWFQDFNASFEDGLQTAKKRRRSSVHNLQQQTKTHEKHWRVSKAKAKHKNLFLVCVRQSLDLAEYFADITHYPVQLSREGISKLKIKIADDVKFHPAYVNYNMEFRDYCEMHKDRFDEDRVSVLKHVDRLRILYDQLTNYFDIQSLVRMGLLAESFPLHHRKRLQHLQKTWGSFKLILSFSQPISDVRDYFGAEIGFYFLFLHELSVAMVILAVPTLAVVVMSQIGYAESGEHWLYFIIMIWYRCFTKHWTRKEREYTIQHGLDAYERSSVKELRNVRFVGKPMPLPENEDELWPQVSWVVRTSGRALSTVLTFLFVVVLIVVVVLEYYMFDVLQGRFSDEYWSKFMPTIFGSFCGMQIKFVDALWDTAADWITDLECRMLQSNFENSKRQKTSMVKFVTSMGSLVCFAVAPGYYLSSRKDHEGWARYNKDLRNTLLSTFITRYVLLYGTVTNFVIPFLKIKLMRYTEGESDQDSYKESQLNMLTYGAETLNDDYLNVLLPLGIVLFFGMVEPLLILVMLPTLLIRLRADAWKLLNVYRRPFPRVATSIGIFNKMLKWFAYFMVISNTCNLFAAGGSPAYLLSNSFKAVSSTEGAWLLDVFCLVSVSLVMSIFWHVLGAAVPAYTDESKVEMRRHKLQRHRFLYSSVCESIEVKQVSFDADKVAGRENFDLDLDVEDLNPRCAFVRGCTD